MTDPIKLCLLTLQSNIQDHPSEEQSALLRMVGYWQKQLEYLREGKDPEKLAENLVRKNEKIRAIKLIRECYGMSLLACKTVIDGIYIRFLAGCDTEFWENQWQMSAGPHGGGDVPASERRAWLCQLDCHDVKDWRWMMTILNRLNHDTTDPLYDGDINLLLKNMITRGGVARAVQAARTLKDCSIEEARQLVVALSEEMSRAEADEKVYE